MCMNNKEFKIGDRVVHSQYGNGSVMGDEMDLCYENEVEVKFDNFLPFVKRTRIEIINKTDLKLIQ